MAALPGTWTSGARRPRTSWLRLGGLLLLLRVVEQVAEVAPRVVRPLALLGHETLLVYVLHLCLLFGGVLGTAPPSALGGPPGLRGPRWCWSWMLPVLLLAAFCWRAFKTRAPHESTLVLAFLGTVLVFGAAHASLVTATMAAIKEERT